MTQVVIICVCGLLILSSVVALKCGPNEIEVDCASVCASDYCPTSEGQNLSCPQPKCPAPVCKCQFDYRRAENGTCIPTKECPPFECNLPHEVYTACPPACSDGCDQRTLDGECPPTFGLILIALPCSPACRCKRGYWRNDGKCVPYARCPQK